MNIPSSYDLPPIFREGCEACEIYKEALESEEPACCVWYMDNVVLGSKTVRDCPNYRNS